MPNPLYDTAKQNLIAQSTGSYLWTRPDKKKQADTNYYDEQQERLSWGVDQAVSRGLIDPATAEDAKQGDDRSWWDHLWGFDKSSKSLMGGVAQPIIDVLSLGNYAAAATTRATMDDPLLRIGDLKVGFTPSAWMKAFRERPYYTDIVDNFGIGLAFDIGLDPMTWLTFGAGAGTKIGVGGIAKIGQKAVPQGLKRLTMTRYGEELFNLASRKFVDVGEKIVKEESDRLVAAGGQPNRLIDEQKMFAMFDNIGEYMVENYDTLVKEHKQYMGKWQSFKDTVRGGITGPLDSLKTDPWAAHKAEDMFVETARMQHSEHGMTDVLAGGRAIKGILPAKIQSYIDSSIKAIAPNFNRTYGVPDDLQKRWHLTKNSIERQSKEKILEIQENLGDLTHDELKLITRILDAGDSPDHTGRMFSLDQKQLMHVLTTKSNEQLFFSERVLKAKEWVKENLAWIYEYETAAGFKIDKAEDYIQRVWKVPSIQTLMLNKVKNSELSTGYTVGRGWQQHRTIASLEDAIAVIGQENIDFNVGSILVKRYKASFRMVEMEKFYDYVKTTSGIAPVMLYRIADEGARVASKLKPMLQSQTPKANRLMDWDQFYAHADAHHIALGFGKDEQFLRQGGTAKNLSLLEYLSMDLSGRVSTAGRNIASKVRPNQNAQVTGQFKRGFTFRGKEHDLLDILKLEYEDGSPVKLLDYLIEHHGKNGKTNAEDIKDFLAKLDAQTRKDVSKGGLETPLLTLFPDLLDKIGASALKHENLSKKVRGSVERVLRQKKGGETVLGKAEEKLKMQVETGAASWKPQLPEEFIVRAKAARMNYGDFSDVAKITEDQAVRIQEYVKDIGLQTEHLKDVTHALLNEKEFMNLSLRDADKLIQFLGLHAGKEQTGNALYNTGVTAIHFGQRAKSAFVNMSRTVEESIAAVESMTLEEMKRSGRVGKFTSQINQAKQYLEGLKASLRGIKKQPKSLQETADVMKETARLEHEIGVAEANIQTIAKEREGHLSPKEAPELERDKRDFISKEEILERNADVLEDKEIKSVIGNRRGVKRNKQLARNLWKESTKPLTKSRRELDKVVKGIREKVEVLEQAKVARAKVLSEVPPEAPPQALKYTDDEFVALKHEVSTLEKRLKRARSPKSKAAITETLNSEKEKLGAATTERQASKQAPPTPASKPVPKPAAASAPDMSKYDAKIQSALKDAEKKHFDAKKKYDEIAGEHSLARKSGEKTAIAALKKKEFFAKKKLDAAANTLKAKRNDWIAETTRVDALPAEAAPAAAEAAAEAAPAAVKDPAIFDSEIRALDKKIVQLQLDEQAAIKKAFDLGDSNIKILPGARYMDMSEKTPKVRDIILRRIKGKEPVVLGKKGEQIRAALIHESVMNKKNVEFLEPAYVADFPESVMGTAAGKYYVPEETANFIKDLITPLYNPETNNFVQSIIKGYDKIQNLFKVPLLAPWPSLTFRNGIGNTSLAYLKAGIALAEPQYFNAFIKSVGYAWLNESPVARKMYGIIGDSDKKLLDLGNQTVSFLGDNGKGIKISTLVDELGKRGVMTAWMRDEVFENAPDIVRNQRMFGAAAGAGIGFSAGGPLGAGLGIAMGALLKSESYRMSNLFRFQELASEIPTRLMLGVYAFKQTGSFDEAGKIVRHFLHDYSELSVFERRVMRRMIPFYNFTKLAFRTVFGAMVNSPGRLMLPHKVFNSQNISGLGFDQPSNPEDVPDWFHKQMVFMGKNIDEETGKMKSWVYSGFNLPLQEVLQLADIIAPGGENVTMLGSRTTFLATSIGEYLMNYDSFRGAPIYPNVKVGIKQTQWESGNSFKGAPEWLKTLVGFHIGEDEKARVNPKMAWLIGEIPTSRFMTVAKKVYEMEDDERKGINYQHLSGQILGLNQYKYDPQQQKFFKNMRKIETLATVLANIQHLKSYDIDRSTFTPPDKRRKKSNPFTQTGLAGNGPLTRF